MKLSTLVAKTKQVEFDYDGETVHMEVRHQLITPKLVADLGVLDDAAVDFSERTHLISEHLARLVVKWDVLDDDGAMFPLKPELLAAEIPVVFQAHCLMEAVQAMKPGEVQAPGA